MSTVSFAKMDVNDAAEALSMSFTPRSAYRVMRDGQDLGIVVRAAVVPDWFAEGCKNAHGLRVGFKNRERAAHALCINADRRTAMLLTMAQQIEVSA